LPIRAAFPHQEQIMTCIKPAGTSDPLSDTVLSTASGPPPIPCEERRHLDRQRLSTGVVTRQKRLAEIEMEMVAACEHAAARGAASSVRIDDRGTWDRATWDRYLAAAARLEPDYGPRLRPLYQELDRLNRLMALPLAA
jgi:hypothetical protein